MFISFMLHPHTHIMSILVDETVTATQTVSKLSSGPNQMPGKPVAHHSEELVANTAFEPWAMSTVLPFPVLQLREIGLQARLDHAPRMGIICAMQHQDRRLDHRE
jgi:hypothetical protein